MQNDDPELIIELSADESTFVHTFGISNNAEVNLLQKTADAGRGTFTLVEDQETMSSLYRKVTTTVKKCLEPALEDCSIIWGSGIK